MIKAAGHIGADFFHPNVFYSTVTFVSCFSDTLILACLHEISIELMSGLYLSSPFRNFHSVSEDVQKTLVICDVVVLHNA